jgi:hypothetical protein
MLCSKEQGVIAVIVAVKKGGSVASAKVVITPGFPFPFVQKSSVVLLLLPETPFVVHPSASLNSWLRSLVSLETFQFFFESSSPRHKRQNDAVDRLPFHAGDLGNEYRFRRSSSAAFMLRSAACCACCFAARAFIFSRAFRRLLLSCCLSFDRMS